MTWEETIVYIRKEPDFKHVVESCYYNEILTANIESFKESDEFKETLKLINHYTGNNNPKRLIDIGSGNGIAAVSFALLGWDVVALEPDASNTIGSGAIKILKEHYNLKNLKVLTEWGEKIPLEDETFDVVYARQVLHHAHDLNKLLEECARLLKPTGLFFSNRDHVVNDEAQKAVFFKNHPLHKFYGGENAFSLDEYINAIKKANLVIEKMYGPIDNIIQLDKFQSDDMVDNYLYSELTKVFKSKLGGKIGNLIASATGRSILKIPTVKNRFHRFINKKTNYQYSWAGRTFAFIAKK